MSAPIRMVPKTPETIAALTQIIHMPLDKPIVAMDEKSARDMPTIWASIRAATWLGKNDACYPTMPADRKEFWGAFAAQNAHMNLPVAETFIKESTGKEKVAVDLGCGDSPAAKLLLGRGWRVIAVDNSRSALVVLAGNNQAALRSGQLTIVEADITEFAPSEPVDLVIAADSLQYIDPMKFEVTWRKIHGYIKEKGFFIGSLLRAAPIPDPLLMSAMNGMKAFGAWVLPDRRMVRPLLEHVGYQIQICGYRVDLPEKKDQLWMQFIAQKKSEDRKPTTSI